jgi:hypothetical protein
LGHWNYRVIKDHNSTDEDPFYHIHEVYYDEDDGSIRNCTSPVEVCAESVDGLRWVLSSMLAALDKPVLTDNDFPGRTPQMSRDECHSIANAAAETLADCIIAFNEQHGIETKQDRKGIIGDWIVEVMHTLYDRYVII